MDPFSLSLGVLTLLKGAAIVVHYAQEVKDGGEERERLVEEISRLMRLLKRLQQAIDDAQEGDPWFENYQALSEPGGALEQLQKVVSELESELQPQGRLRRLGQKLSWPFSKSHVKYSLEAIGRHSREIEHFLSQGHFELSKDIRTDVRALREAASREHFEAVLSWLSPLKFAARQGQLLGDAVAAGQWLFDSPEFVGWISGKRRILMCHGAPGVGKTMLSSLAIEHLQHTQEGLKVAVIFVFFTHKERREQTASSLLGSLLKQLLQHTNEIPKKVEELYRECKEKDTRPSTDKLFDLLKQQLQSFSRVYVIVDALDESEEDTRKAFIDYLVWANHDRTSFLWTARSLGDMIGLRSVYCSLCGFVCGDCEIDGSAQCQDCQDHTELCEKSSSQPSGKRSSATIQIVAQEDDIRKYIDKRIKESSRLFQACRKNPSLKAKITEAVINTAKGMFLIARLQIDYLRCKPPTPSIILAALKTLPTTPDDLYVEAITRIKNQNAEDVDLAMRLLGWVAFARRPLIFDELQHAMGIRDGDNDLDDGELLDQDFLLSLTAGLVTVDSDGAAVRLIHFTAYEFLYERKQELFQDTPRDITLKLLTYLNFESFSEPCRGEHEDVDVEKRFVEYPLLRYVSQFWGIHASECYRDDDSVRSAVLALVCHPLKLASSIQAAWYTSHSWGMPMGVSSLHVCAWFGLDDILSDLVYRGLPVDLPDHAHGLTPLMYACKNGRLTTAKTLLSLGASVNQRSASGSTALVEALYEGHTGIAEFLATLIQLETNASYWTRSILMIGVWYRYHEFVRLLLSRHDIQVNMQDSDGNTALALAVERKDYELAKMILSKKDLDINLADKHSYSPLRVAAMHGNHEMVRLLLDHGADSSIADSLGGTPLMRAVDFGREAVVRLLIEYSDAHALDLYGRSLLHSASVNGHNGMIRLLVDVGLDVNAQGTYGETPLHDTCRCGHPHVTKTLLDLGANPLIEDNNGIAPRLCAMQYANEESAQLLAERELELGSEVSPIELESLPAWSIVRRRTSQLMEEFIARGGDVNETGYDAGEAAIHYATQHNDTEIVKQLLEAGANPDVADKFGMTALKIAAWAGSGAVGAAKLLIQHGANLEIGGLDGTSLTMAQATQNFEVALELIKAGAKIDPDAEPIQPTFFAAVKLGDVEAVKVLIKHGAETQTRDPEGHTALQLAKLQGHAEVMKVLREHNPAFLASRSASERALDRSLEEKFQASLLLE